MYDTNSDTVKVGYSDKPVTDVATWDKLRTLEVTMSRITDQTREMGQILTTRIANKDAGVWETEKQITSLHDSFLTTVNTVLGTLSEGRAK